MGLMTPQQYRESLSDGREIYWDGERIEDVNDHPAFALPLEVAAGDYDYDDPVKREHFLYKTEVRGGKEQYLWSFDVATARELLGVEVGYDEEAGRFSLGEEPIPHDGDGLVLVNYVGPPGTFLLVSDSRIISA